MKTYPSMIDDRDPKLFFTDHRYSTLEDICSLINEQLSKSKATRVICSGADGVKFNEYRKRLNYAMQKFEVRSSV